LVLSSSGLFLSVSSGSVWYGIKQKNLLEINSSVSPTASISFYYHSASAWVVENKTDGLFINNRYDNGINLQTVPYGSYIVNYIWRGIGTANRVALLVSDAMPSLTQAQIFVPPEPPLFFKDFGILVGRIIIQSGSITAVSVDSAFKPTLPITRTPQHNDLLNIQGGTASLNANEYYHLTNAEYTGTGTGIIVRTSGPTVTNANISGSLFGTSSWATNTISSSYFQSTIQSVVSASWASQSLSASYVNIRSLVTNIVTSTASYMLTNTDYTLIMSGSYALSASLPNAAANPGITYNIKNVSLSNVTVTGSQNIDGSTNGQILTRWNTITVQSDGIQWYII